MLPRTFANMLLANGNNVPKTTIFLCGCSFDLKDEGGFKLSPPYASNYDLGMWRCMVLLHILRLYLGKYMSPVGSRSFYQIITGFMFRIYNWEHERTRDAGRVGQL